MVFGRERQSNREQNYSTRFASNGNALERPIKKSFPLRWRRLLNEFRLEFGKPQARFRLQEMELINHLRWASVCP